MFFANSLARGPLLASQNNHGSSHSFWRQFGACGWQASKIIYIAKPILDSVLYNEYRVLTGGKAAGAWRLDCVWNVMARARKPDFVFRRNVRVHLNRHGRQFSRLLAVEVCASAVLMLDTPCSEVVWRVLNTHSIRQFPLHFPSRASPCAITFKLDSTTHPI